MRDFAHDSLDQTAWAKSLTTDLSTALSHQAILPTLRADAQPVCGRMFQTPFSDQIRNEASLATMCVGAITTADQVNTIIAAGRADLVALARPHLVDPYFSMKAAAWYGAPGIHCPPQYLAGKEQIFRNSARDREEWRDLRLKAKPKGHRDTWKEAAE